MSLPIIFFYAVTPVSDAPAELLLFPVRSMRGIFAWLTTQQRLIRLQEIVNNAGFVEPFPLGERDSLYTEEGVLLVNPKSHCLDRGKVYLEEYAFRTKTHEAVEKVGIWLSKWALPDSSDFEWWRKKIIKDLFVVSDVDFQDMTTMTCYREYVEGNFSAEEMSGGAYRKYLPSESMFYSVLSHEDPQNQLLIYQLPAENTSSKGLLKQRVLEVREHHGQ